MNRKHTTIFLVAILVGGLVFSGIAMADEHTDRAQGPDDCPTPGFVSGLVQDVTPQFLKDVIGGLPVPSFVKGFFGADSGC